MAHSPQASTSTSSSPSPTDSPTSSNSPGAPAGPSVAPASGGVVTWGGPPSIGHLALFNQLVAKKNMKLEWVYSDGNEPGVIHLPAPGASHPCIHGASSAAGGPNAFVVAGECQPHVNAPHLPGSTSQFTQLQPPGTEQQQQQPGFQGPGQWYADPGVPSTHLIKGTHTTPVWYAKAIVDGEFYGRGRGNTKKAAKNEAAKEGLVKLGVEV